MLQRLSYTLLAILFSALVSCAERLLQGFLVSSFPEKLRWRYLLNLSPLEPFEGFSWCTPLTLSRVVFSFQPSVFTLANVFYAQPTCPWFNHLLFIQTVNTLIFLMVLESMALVLILYCLSNLLLLIIAIHNMIESFANAEFVTFLK